MKYVENNRADKFGTFTQLDGIMKCSAAIATNTALKVAGDERYSGRIAARALYEQIAFCEAGLAKLDEKDVAKSREFVTKVITPITKENEREMRREFMAAIFGIK